MLSSLHSLWDAFWAIPHIRVWLGLAWLAYLIPLCLWIVLQKREPVATLSWLMSLSLLPYVGYLVYFLLGPQKIKRQRLRRFRTREGIRHTPAFCSLDADCTELALLGQATTGLPPSSATEVHLLVDGGATYDAVVEAIAAAQNHVHVAYYIFEPDRTGTRIRDALIERARNGVKVRLLVDAVGSARLKPAFVQPLLDAGGEFAWFHPRQFKLFTRPWLNMRSHRKIVVVDGRVALTGGINVTDEEDERLREDAYRDLHMRLQGDIVRSVQQVFVEDWVYATGQDKSAFRDTQLLPARDGSLGAIPVQALASGPDSSWEAIHRMHVSAIHAASKRVWMITPYFVPGEAARMALSSAALGGLDVRLIVPKMSDSKLVTFAARSYFDELLDAGVKVYEYGPRMLHTKAMLCDDNLAIIGSANFDHRSFRLNFELSMLIRGPGVVRELSELMKGEFGNAARVPKERERNLWKHRLPEALARLTSPLL
ncbi:cardiolipin synthase [Pseudoxanthomonas kalamensis DSM 18571]|uniref:cardiolipin synthase n=1 Tax=Pseudoxanthomonas kalamensis TaxID=289483 RepID=UPI0013918AD5|nr:cardiolipin synthase [Pseudoxanthomonas kalamensis]KAF1712318.1 cardiolipin synthase [Pseudoxanthomonas kalamensis DSM 18571]